MDPRYQPRLDQLEPAEETFLKLTYPMGHDWMTSRQTFRDRFGVHRYYDWCDVVGLPESTAFSDAPLQFYFYADDKRMDLPPEYLFAMFSTFDDPYNNHREMLQMLEARLGPSEASDNSNCLQRTWSFGIFEVALHTFPKELQHPETLRSNIIYQKDPKTIDASHISLISKYAYVYPDASLAFVTQRIGMALSGQPDDGLILIHTTDAEPPPLPISIRASRRHSPKPSFKMPMGCRAAWRDDEGGRIGISCETKSLVFDRQEVKQLALVRMTKAQGPGRSSIELKTVGPHSCSTTEAIPVLCGAKPDSLDRVAESLAALWALEYETCCFPDD